MEKEMHRTIPFPYQNRGSYNASLVAFDIPTLIKKMKHNSTWENGELNATILLKSPAKKIVLAIVHKGTEITSFQTNDSITFQVIEGKLRLYIRNEAVTLNRSELLTLNERIYYSYHSMEETAFLLTLASGIFHRAEN